MINFWQGVRKGGWKAYKVLGSFDRMKLSIPGKGVKECRIVMLVISEIMESLRSFGNYTKRGFPSVLIGIKLMR